MKKIHFPILVILVILLGSCGYRFVTGGLLPGKIKTVAVKVFENNSFYSGAENAFTNALIQEIIQNSGTRVVSVDKAQAVISGTIRSVTFSGLSRTALDQVLERRVVAVIDIEMTDETGEVVWQLKNYKGVEDSTVSSENVSDEASKKETINKAALKMAQKIVGKMLDDF